MLGRLTEEMSLSRGQKGRARNVPGNDLAEFGRERAQAEEAAASRRVCGWAGMVSVIVYSRSFGDAVIDHIGMGEAVDRFVAMAEGNRRRRHDEAQHRECCEYGRELKAKPGRERNQHGFRVVFTLAFIKIPAGNRLHKLAHRFRTNR